PPTARPGVPIAKSMIPSRLKSPTASAVPNPSPDCDEFPRLDSLSSWLLSEVMPVNELPCRIVPYRTFTCPAPATLLTVWSPLPRAGAAVDRPVRHADRQIRHAVAIEIAGHADRQQSPAFQRLEPGLKRSAAAPRSRFPSCSRAQSSEWRSKRLPIGHGWLLQ